MQLKDLILFSVIVFFLAIIAAFAIVKIFMPEQGEGLLSEHIESSDQNNKNENTITDTGYSVYIETGHGIGDDGKWDAGCSWSDGETTYEEAKIMIPIARSMAEYLKKSGVTVYTDAYDNNNINLMETLRFLDSHNVDAFVNLHCDWEEADSGTMPLYRTEEQKRLAEALNKGVHSEVTIPDRGVTYRDDLDTLTSDQVHCPAVLFETGSIKEDNKVLTAQYDEYGRGLAKGICSYFGIIFDDGTIEGNEN